MPQSRYLILATGIVLFALLLGFWWVPASVRKIETDIAARSDVALRAIDRAARAAVSGQQVTLSGEVGSDAQRDMLLQRIESLVGVTRVHDQLSVSAASAVPDNYTFEAVRGAAEVLLTGFVVNDAQRASVVGLARQAFAPTRVVDRLESAPGAPPGFDALIKLGLSHLASLDSGSFRFSGDSAQLSGVAPDPGKMLEIESAFAGLDDGRVSLATRLSVRRADAARRQACQTSFDRIMNANSIGFAIGSAIISPDSFPLLDAVASTAKDCADVNVEVRGHTDSAGNAQSNRRLSALRAQAVVDYLVREGVDPDKLSARGLGAEVPVASNDTPAGRAANRRIEFSVLDVPR